MMRIVSQWLDVPSIDPDDARRRKLLNILLMGVAAVTLLGLLATIFAGTAGLEGPERITSLSLASLVALAGIAIIYMVNRYWAGWLASLLFLLLLTVIFAFTDEPQQVVEGRSMFLFTIPILIASVLLQPWASFIMAGLTSLVITVVALNIQLVPPVPSMLGFFAIALVSWLAARNLERALADLRAINEGLDQRVVERTQDLSEALAREHAEASKNQAILEGIADGVIVFDHEDKAIVANPAITRLIEQPYDEITGRDIRTLMGRDVNEIDKDVITDLLADKEVRHPSVKLQWGEKTLSVSFAPVRGDSGKVTGTVAVFRDFTREAELDRMKSDFVSIASHELRTPMTSIKGYIDLLLMGAPGPVGEQQGKFLQIVKDNTERLHELVNDLLDISRIESGRIELDVQVVSVPEIIGKVANFLQKQFDDRGLTLTQDVPSDLPEVFGDPDRITQIMTNLLSNAYKYTVEGGATVRARRDDSFLQVDVIDTGVGISAEDQEKLFSRFFRAEDEFVRAQPGTGLGLNITQSLVQMHGGKMWVQSEPGVGSTFSFTLPLPGTVGHRNLKV
jgi:PAS domain S-box-containing protein